jgi:hypothetical protein
VRAEGRRTWLKHRIRVLCGSDGANDRRLHGDAHAGIHEDKMDRTAVICCLDALPNTVSIGNVFKIDIRKSMEMVPAVPTTTICKSVNQTMGILTLVRLCQYPQDNDYEGSPVLLHVGPKNEICTVLAKDETSELPHKRHMFIKCVTSNSCLPRAFILITVFTASL